jgi:hypothetical protein
MDTGAQMRLGRAAETGASLDEATGALVNAANLPGVWSGTTTAAAYGVAYLVSRG